MKNIVFAFLLISLFSCQSGKKQELNYVLLSGTVENPTSDKVRITGNNYKIEIPLNDDHTFSDTLWIPQTGYFSFAEGRESSAMFLNMGDQIQITVNTAEFDETLNYAGKGAEKNNYLAKKYLESEINAPAFDQFFALNENEFIDLNKLIYSQEMDLLTSSAIPDENFVEMEKKALEKETDKASVTRLEKVKEEQANLREKSSGLMAQWRNEKAIIDQVRAAQEKIEALKNEVERAQRIGDLTRASQITYGDLPGAHGELEAAKDQLHSLQTQGALLTEEVTEDDIDLVAALVRLVGDLLVVQIDGLDRKWISRLEAYLADQRAKIS